LLSHPGRSEREREAVAKQRHRELMEAKRAAQLKHKFEEDRVRAERVSENALKDLISRSPNDYLEHSRSPTHAVPIK
jgi:hypothetical protein